MEVKHFVLDDTTIRARKAIVHFNFRERSELTPTLTSLLTSVEYDRSNAFIQEF